MLTEILDTAKLESGKMELHRHNSPPVELLRAAVQEARRGRPTHIADLVTVVLQPGLHPIHVDPLRTTQAVTHLLNYAIDAAKGGKITLRARESDGSKETRLFVIDLQHEGELSPEAAANLFDGFRRGASGVGLHLALPLARRLVELHGGSLELVAPGGLPVARIPATGASPDSPEPPGADDGANDHSRDDPPRARIDRRGPGSVRFKMILPMGPPRLAG
jgi:signal transduction histidine kinase